MSLATANDMTPLQKVTLDTRHPLGNRHPFGHGNCPLACIYMLHTVQINQSIQSLLLSTFIYFHTLSARALTTEGQRQQKRKEELAGGSSWDSEHSPETSPDFSNVTNDGEPRCSIHERDG